VVARLGQVSELTYPPLIATGGANLASNHTRHGDGARDFRRTPHEPAAAKSFGWLAAPISCLPSGAHFSVDGTLIQTPQTHLRHSERSHRELVDFYRRRYVCAPPHGDTGGSQVLSAGAFP
jgi:hypothetical protein